MNEEKHIINTRNTVKKLRIGTYNISKCENWKTYLDTGKWVINVDAITQVIKKMDVEICGLQEVLHKDLNTGQAQEIATSLGWNYLFVPTLSICPDGRNSEMMYGNALLSRYPIISYKSINISASLNDKTLFACGKGEYCEDRNIIIAELDINGTPITVINTHMGLADSEKDNAILSIKKVLSSSSQPVIVIGDFNMAPDNPKLQILNTYLKDSIYGMKNMPSTFPSEQPAQKIDYIFVPKTSTIFKVGTISDLASDHLPFYIHAAI